MRWVLGLVLSATLGLPAVVLAQTPAPTCEEQVGTLYRSLVKDRQMYEVPSSSWAQQLTAIATQVRIVTREFKTQQAFTEQIQGQEAQQADAVRQLIEQLQTVRAELEKLKAPEAQK